MPDDSRDEFLPENEREGCKKLSHYVRTYVSSRQQSLTVACLLYRVASVLQQAVLSNNKDIKGISLLITINLFICKLHL